MASMLLNSEDYHVLPGETTFRNHPLRELTFSDLACSKKRGYMEFSQHDYLQEQRLLEGSLEVTTSGCPLATVVTQFSGDISSGLYCHRVEIDALIRFQTEQLQSGTELLRRKHNRELLSMVEQQATKRLRMKEIELRNISKTNLELEEQVRQMTAESHVWFNYAKTTEALVLSLRAKLEQVLRNQISCPAVHVEEGYGDSGGDPFLAAHEAGKESETENQIKMACMVCGEREVCVLLLPCRHLYVCKECEFRIEACPICSSPRNASIQL